MTLRYLVILFSIITVPFALYGQNHNETVAGSSVLLTYNTDGKSYFGSGFMVFKETDFKNHLGSHFLITNLHVLERCNGDFKMRFYRKNYSDIKTRMELSVTFKDKHGNYLPKVRMNFKKEDVVAIDITEEYQKNDIEGLSLDYRLLATKDTLTKYDVSVGDEIYVVGYPDGIYDSKNYSPIFRYGILASIPTENYSFNRNLQDKYHFPVSIPGFLIDASIFPGSSGSLIILKQQIGKISRNTINMGSTRPYILGIVQKSIPIEDIVPGNIQRLGLGVAYSAQTIKETIDFGVRLAGK